MFSVLYKKKQERRCLEKKQPIAQMISGRRHRIDTPYLLPQDLQEIHRLDFQHYALRAALGGDYLAPLDRATIKTILDVGCGTGLWAREQARVFSEAEVTGVDIEYHLPALPLPKNVRFVQANILDGLPFADSSFDFVHQRLLVGAIPDAKWQFVIDELARVTRPGGRVELLESGSVYHCPGPATRQFQTWWQAGEKKLGFNLARLAHLDQMLKKAGFRDVQMKTVHLPLGKWGGRAGEMLAIDIHTIFTSFRAVYVSRLGVPAQRFEEALAQLPAEWERCHTAYEVYVAYGRRK